MPAVRRDVLPRCRRLARPRVKWACRGEPTATFLYPTPGAQGIRQALKIMNGEKVEKKVTLETMAIDKTKREKILKENGIV
jgi:ribose transport system substrate-binding protein